MNVFLLFRIDWTTHNGHYKTLVDVYRHFKDADEEREALFDSEGYTDVDHGTDFEVEERELK